MSTTPVLALPNFSLPFTIESDASYTGIGAVLMQELRPLSYYSKGLSIRNLGLSTYEKELLAIVQAVKRWRPYLEGTTFVIKTDHQSLKYLLEQKMSSLLQHKWVSKLLGLDYTISYKKGSETKLLMLCPDYQTKMLSKVSELLNLREWWHENVSNIGEAQDMYT